MVWDYEYGIGITGRTESAARCTEMTVADAGATREGRPGRGLMRCGSWYIARSRQNGLGSIPLFCVTRSVDRLTDGGHGGGLTSRPGCASLSLPEGLALLRAQSNMAWSGSDGQGKAILFMVCELEISDWGDAVSGVVVGVQAGGQKEGHRPLARPISCPAPSPARPLGAAERQKERTRMRPAGPDAPAQR